MDFEENMIYHVYNQGNNRENLFFSHDNYLFFIEKIKKHVLPFADIFAWCLMPNHFHLMIYLNRLEIFTHTMTGSHSMSKEKTCSLNQSIAILLRSYTRAINNQEQRTGSLFRAHTQAKCLNNHVPTPYLNLAISLSDMIDQYTYAQICFEYIHENPVKSGIVRKAEFYEYSSAREYVGKSSFKIIDANKARKYISKTEKKPNYRKS